MRGWIVFARTVCTVIERAPNGDAALHGLDWVCERDQVPVTLALHHVTGMLVTSFRISMAFRSTSATHARSPILISARSNPRCRKTGSPRCRPYHPGQIRLLEFGPIRELLDRTAQCRAESLPVPLRDPRFVVDVNLGRLARLLRVLGFDVWWSYDADDRALAHISLGQHRILLTRDRGLLKRRAITHGLFVHSELVEEQSLEVIRRLDLRQRLAPFTRCVRCNGTLAAVRKDEVVGQLQSLTRRYYDTFSRCAQCRQIYWPGSHQAKLVSLVERLRSQL